MQRWFSAGIGELGDAKTIRQAFQIFVETFPDWYEAFDASTRSRLRLQDPEDSATQPTSSADRIAKLIRSVYLKDKQKKMKDLEQLLDTIAAAARPRIARTCVCINARKAFSPDGKDSS